jgi:hypothetical protein
LTSDCKLNSQKDNASCSCAIPHHVRGESQRSLSNSDGSKDGTGRFLVSEETTTFFFDILHSGFDDERVAATMATTCFARDMSSIDSSQLQYRVSFQFKF